MGFNEESKLNDDQMNDVTGGYKTHHDEEKNVLTVHLEKSDSEFFTMSLESIMNSVETEIQTILPAFILSNNDRTIITQAYNNYFSYLSSGALDTFYVKLTGNRLSDCIESINIYEY